MVGKILSVVAIVAMFAGCGEEEEKPLKKPPVANEVPSDVSVATPDPMPEINPQLPPTPVAE